MTHWMEMYIDKYKDMDLIDRKALLEHMRKEAEAIAKDPDDVALGDDYLFAIACIEEAEKINPIDIIQEFEKNCEEEKKWNP